jgi:hypothetical protein
VERDLVAESEPAPDPDPEPEPELEPTADSGGEDAVVEVVPTVREVLVVCAVYAE